MVFALTSNTELVNEICNYLNLEPGKISVKHFADGEILVEPEETVRGKKVYIVQSTCNPVTERLMELLICVDAMKRASAGEITCIIPYYGYARQDRKAAPRQPITSKLVADLLDAAGADRVVTIDLHAAQIQGFFNFPTDVDGNCNRGTLNLVNWSDREDKILVEVPFPQLEKLPKMNYAQSSGTYQTYMKRYLILHTFDIVEDEIIDATEMSVEVDKQERAKSSKGGKANATKGKTAPKKKMNVQKKPKALQKVIDRFYEENGTDAECTPNKLNGLSMKMFREKEITKDERVEIYDYLKK